MLNDDGYITGHGSIFGNVDSYGDMRGRTTHLLLYRGVGF